MPFSFSDAALFLFRVCFALYICCSANHADFCVSCQLSYLINFWYICEIGPSCGHLHANFSCWCTSVSHSPLTQPNGSPPNLIITTYFNPRHSHSHRHCHWIWHLPESEFLACRLVGILFSYLVIRYRCRSVSSLSSSCGVVRQWALNSCSVMVGGMMSACACVLKLSWLINRLTTVNDSCQSFARELTQTKTEKITCDAASKIVLCTLRLSEQLKTFVWRVRPFICDEQRCHVRLNRELPVATVSLLMYIGMLSGGTRRLLTALFAALLSVDVRFRW